MRCMNIFGLSGFEAGEYLPSAGGTLQGNLNLGGHAITNTKELILVENKSPDTPPPGALSLYANSNQLRYNSRDGTITELASQNSVSSTQNRTQVLAPAGLRDHWQNLAGLNFSGGVLSYYPKTQLLVADAQYGKYSTNYGLTWAPLVYDVDPTYDVGTM